MSDIIHLLPDHIANQIAAGEVIQRPASVVKELMENAIDAGATQIKVNIKEAGRTLIQVIDNGKGMSETDARMAFERHSTSKIAAVEDLFSLHTMGFRGEALASIAAVAQVELHTRTKGGDVGTCLSISGSALDSVSPDACNEGSVFSVRNLFYNVPARRKFLKSNETEFRHILAEYERVVLTHPDISFTLTHNETLVSELPSGGVKQRIADVFGKGMNQKLLPMGAETSLANISGFVGSLDSAKRRGSLQYFFVNGRYMRHPYFHKAVMQAYERMIPAGETPDYFIYFDIDPATIDVNIHPTKTEIKFENERPVWQIVFSAVREALAKSNSVPTIDFETVERIEIPVYNPAKKNAVQPKLQVDKGYNPFRAAGHAPSGGDWAALYESFKNDSPAPPSPSAGEADNGPVSGDAPAAAGPMFAEEPNPCFQYKNKYIIAPLRSGLVVINQHRAHIRILYERFLGNMQRKSSPSQQLLFPEMAELTPAEAAMLPSIEEDMRFLGFDIVPLGGCSYAINAVPPDASGSPAALLKDVVGAAMESGASAESHRKEALALSLAKATAIPAGKALAPEEMETLVAALFSLENNGLTPDGKIVLTTITDEELSGRM